jgi:hypothetical protein
VSPLSDTRICVSHYVLLVGSAGLSSVAPKKRGLKERFFGGWMLHFVNDSGHFLLEEGEESSSTTPTCAHFMQQTDTFFE